MKVLGWIGMGLLIFCAYYVALMMAISFIPVLLMGVAIRAIDFSDIPRFWVWCFQLGYLGDGCER